MTCSTSSAIGSRRVPTTAKAISIAAVLLFAFLLLVASLSPPVVEATDIKWHAGGDGGGDEDPEVRAAKNAPRSQRYWDEHNIKRPDYAKTDAEVAAERWAALTEKFPPFAGAGALVLLLLLLAGAAAVAAMYLQSRGGAFSGKRLGSVDANLNFRYTALSSTSSSSTSTAASSGGYGGSGGSGGVLHAEERAREARLRRFEMLQQQQQQHRELEAKED